MTESKPSKATYTIHPAPASSIPTLSHISALAFKTDTHTQLKELCSRPPKDGTSLYASSMASGLSSWMAPSMKGRVVVLQAVEKGSGEIVGWAAWAGVGVELSWDRNEKLVTNGDDEKVVGDRDQGENQGANADGKEGGKEKEKADKGDEEDEEEQNTSPQIRALETLTNDTMSFWSSHFRASYTTSLSPSPSPSPSPKPHLILISLVIHPSHQGRGIGSSLINWGTQIADTQGVFCWVSSSDGGWKVFERAGFREVGRLAVDLDDFAFGVDGGRVGRPDEEDGKWGAYTWRWMKRGVVKKD